MDKCKVEIDTTRPGRRDANITPEGFWPYDGVSVFQSDGDSVWKAPQISWWGSGGEDDSLSSIESAKSFIFCLQKAVVIAEAWNADTGRKSR